ncbi:MAG: hypothetical protein A2V89_02965 [Gammaproteobacteria bacterium RBG_16_37_9]|nr:MAG: hypothetical protein A2V89_02965 [Gammaproteobacteria bacterium RBG_16_37_9]
MKLKPVVASLVMLGLMAPAFAKSSMASQQAVIDQNAVTSPVCSEGWFNRITVGGLGSVVGLFGNHDPAGMYTDIGSSTDLYVNNVNLLVNANLSCWSKATVNLAYFGSPDYFTRMEDSGAGGAFSNKSGKLGALRRISHNVVADEAYVTIGNLAKYPFYAKIGKGYVPFGVYSNPYTPYQIMSPAQILAQTNAVSAVAGVTTDFGFYGSASAFRDSSVYPRGSSVGNIRNFSAQVGYYDHLDAFNVPNGHVNFALSYIKNLWGSQFFSPDRPGRHTWFENASTATNGASQIDPAAGLNLHADFAYKAFSMFADYTGALQSMATATSSKFWGANVNADYAFKTLDRDSHFGLGMQWSGNGKWFGVSAVTATVTDPSTVDFMRIIPKWRFVGEYGVNIFKNTDLNFVFAHGKSYDFVTAPVSRNSTLGLARLNFQF